MHSQLHWQVDHQLHCQILLFLNFSCSFKCSLKWNLRCTFRCNLKCSLNFTFNWILINFVHSYELTITWTSVMQVQPEGYLLVQRQKHLFFASLYRLQVHYQVHRIAYHQANLKWLYRWSFCTLLCITSSIKNFTLTFIF